MGNERALPGHGEMVRRCVGESAGEAAPFDEIGDLGRDEDLGSDISNPLHPSFAPEVHCRFRTRGSLSRVSACGPPHALEPAATRITITRRTFAELNHNQRIIRCRDLASGRRLIGFSAA